MARRLTAAEKGKGLASDHAEPQVKRIRAPSLDTSALIEDNSLTLIGRLTNPQEQRIRTLITSLPRIWNIQGDVVGSDLGHNCFQFRFEKEEDLRDVLDNRPYHFGYWMVIIQRWEPIISETFPSLIRLWVRIKGLPLHFWHETMVCNIGKELGTYEKYELTKTSARIRVLVNGLKPLTKEYIIEYGSGEESKITLEYERLENHCSICLCLSQRSEICPSLPEKDNQQKRQDLEPEVESYIPPKETMGEYQSDNHPKRVISENVEKYRSHNDFGKRVDRHGRRYGERISTRHTRNPPPLKEQVSPHQMYARRSRHEPQDKAEYSSPQYTKQRRHHPYESSRRGPLFPQKDIREWRVKQNLDTRQKESTPTSTRQAPAPPVPQEQTLQDLDVNLQTQTREEIMEQLQEYTRQYLSCEDLTEAAARRI